MKLKEEEQRAVRYLETRKGCDSVAVVSRILPKANIPKQPGIREKYVFCLVTSMEQRKSFESPSGIKPQTF